MKTAKILSCGLLVLLAACGEAGQEQQQAAPARPITMANRYHDALLAAQELPRFATIRATIARNGPPCRTVTGAAYQENYQNMKLWVVRCASGRPSGGSYRYGLFLAPDGNSQVRSCAAMPGLGLPACRPDLPPQTAPASAPAGQG